MESFEGRKDACSVKLDWFELEGDVVVFEQLSQAEGRDSQFTGERRSNNSQRGKGAQEDRPLSQQASGILTFYSKHSKENVNDKTLMKSKEQAYP